MYLTFIRWSGLAAVAAGVLLIIATLVSSFFVFSQTEPAAGGTLSQLIVVLRLSVSLFLVVGVVGLYARLSETVGSLGLAGFLAIFGGLLTTQLGVEWGPLLTELGYALFGMSILLRARTYPRTAALLLIIGAALRGVGTALIFVGLASGMPPVYVVSALGAATIIYGVGIAWLGLALFRERVSTNSEDITANNGIDLEEGRSTR